MLSIFFFSKKWIFSIIFFSFPGFLSFCSSSTTTRYYCKNSIFQIAIDSSSGGVGLGGRGGGGGSIPLDKLASFAYKWKEILFSLFWKMTMVFGTSGEGGREEGGKKPLRKNSIFFSPLCFFLFFNGLFATCKIRGGKSFDFLRTQFPEYFTPQQAKLHDKTILFGFCLNPVFFLPSLYLLDLNCRKRIHTNCLSEWGS